MGDRSVFTVHLLHGNTLITVAALRSLATLTNIELSAWMQQAKVQALQGQVNQRIPKLATANPDWFAVSICCESEKILSAGDSDCVFPLMSVIKPFSLLYLLEHCGKQQVFEWVGVKPSDLAFNSLEQLLADGNRPRNPMINSGAITLADKLPGKDDSDRTQNFCTWLNTLAGCQLNLDKVMLASVRSTGSQVNRNITQNLTQSGYVKNPEEALATYEQICCLSSTVTDLGLLGKVLACESELISPQHRRIVNALMLTCGMYEASSQYSLQIGLPMKSGISGALLAIVPKQGAIACFSPSLDSVGNSVEAIAFVETLCQSLQLNIFG